MEPIEQNGINTEESLDLWELWTIIRKNLRPILTAFGVVVLLTGICTFFFMPKQYKSSVKFYIQEKESGSGLLSSLMAQGLGGLIPTGVLGNNTNSDLCSDIVLAPSFLRRALRAEKLPSSWRKVEAFSKKVEVTKALKSGALEISVIWKDPVVSYKLAKRLFTNYKQFVDEQINHNNSKNRVFIERQYILAERRLKSAEDRLLSYEKSKGIPVLPETTTIAINYFADLEQQRASTRIGLNDARKRLSQASAILDKSAPQVKNSVADTVNPMLTGYKTKLSELEIELAKARQRFTDEHPAVKALLKEKAELERQIKAESQSLHAPTIAGNYLSGLVEVAGLEARLKSLDQVYHEYYPKMTQLPDAMLTYGQLLREQKVAEQIYIMLAGQLEQARISEAKDDNVVIQVIQPAMVPYKKCAPSTSKNMAVAGMLVLLVGMGMVLWKEKYRAILTNPR